MGDGPNDYGSSRQHLLERTEGCSSGSASRRSTSCNCTGRITTRRSRRRCPPSISSCAQEGPLHRRARISPAGIHASPRRLTVTATPRYVAHQAYYSLLNRDYEWELMQLGRDQGAAQSSGARSAGASYGQNPRGQPPQPRHPRACHSGNRAALRGGASVCDRRRARRRRQGDRQDVADRAQLALRRPTVASVIIARGTKSSCSRTSAPSAGN